MDVWAAKGGLEQLTLPTRAVVVLVGDANLDDVTSDVFVIVSNVSDPVGCDVGVTEKRLLVV